MTNIDIAYGRAVEVMKECMSEYGFLATKTNKDNYKRIFSRDGVILGLASLSTNETDLIDCFKKTLQTLAKYQGEEGEIASNISVKENKISYGGTVGRVDATLWFLIGVSQYFKKTQDKKFLKEIFPSLKKCITVLDSWEFNEKNLIYVPVGGDWADEYINEGYVLYDEVLYYRALKEYSHILEIFKKIPEKTKIDKKIKIIENLIIINFWPKKELIDSKYIYHQGIYKKLLKRHEKRFFISSFSPAGFKNNYDSFGNSLTIIFGLTDIIKTKNIFSFINENFGEKTKYLLPAFSPIITSKDPDWKIIKTNFSYSFKNKPYEYHNGGLWPLVTGFTIIAMSEKKEYSIAQKHLEAMSNAVSLDDWSFPEFLNGKTFKPKGTKHLGFSASSYVLAYNSLINKKKIFL